MSKNPIFEISLADPTAKAPKALSNMSHEMNEQEEAMQRSHRTEDMQRLSVANIRCTGLETKELPLELLENAPDNWNFFGPAPKAQFRIMVNSIHEDGLFDPIFVWERPGGKYMILSGHNRVRAYYQLQEEYPEEADKYKSIEATIYKQDDIEEKDARRIIIITNIARRAKENPRTFSYAVVNYIDVMKSKTKWGEGDVRLKVAKDFGISRTSVFNNEQLVDLIDPLMELYMQGKLPMRAINIIHNFNVQLQNHFYEMNYAAHLTDKRLKALKNVHSISAMDAVFNEPDEEKFYTGSFKTITKRKKTDDSYGFIIPSNMNEAFTELILSGLEVTDLPDDFKQSIKQQLDYQKNLLK